MSILKNILNELNIQTHDELQKYIEENYTSQISIPLKIVRKNDLRLDNENRIYDEEIEYNNTIFDIDELIIKNSDKISFKNCIFTGRLVIQNNERRKLEIYLDYVAIKDSLKILHAENVSSICLSDINTPELIIHNIATNSLHVSSSNIVSFHCTLLNIETCDIYFNSFKNLEFFDNKIKEVNFAQGQLDTSIFLKATNKKIIKKLQKKFSYLKFLKNINYDSIDQIDKAKRVNETCKFLIENSDYHVSKKELANIKYLEGLSSLKNSFHKIIYKIFGGLLNPLIIIGWIFGVIFIFSIIFSTLGFSFCIDDKIREITFLESIYFSGISFATIGYGDISPTGFARFLSVAEGIIGILLSSSFIVSLVRRYID